VREGQLGVSGSRTSHQSGSHGSRRAHICATRGDCRKSRLEPSERTGSSVGAAEGRGGSPCDDGPRRFTGAGRKSRCGRERWCQGKVLRRRARRQERSRCRPRHESRRHFDCQLPGQRSEVRGCWHSRFAGRFADAEGRERTT
ncbi:hypothetical protein OY671_008886, partial [Metschnikowia pulcherrima]